MVASIAQIAEGYAEYFEEISRAGYYDCGGEPPGVWLGLGSAALALTGQISKGVLGKVLDGFLPNGTKLVRNAGSAKRQNGWDLTFSAPKSVSILWGVAEDGKRKEIEEIHQQAVMATIKYLSENACWTRRGAQGAIHERAEPIVASYQHGTSRAQDPNLHSHCLFVNACVRIDGTTGSLSSRDLYRHKMAAGAFYRAALAYGLRNEMGLLLEQVGTWFEIAGIDKGLRDTFSKRRHELLTLAGPGASQHRLDTAAIHSRQVKQHVAQDVLIEQWRAVAQTQGLDAKTVARLFPKRLRKQLTTSDQLKRIDKAVAKAVEDLSYSESFFGRHHVLRAALEKLQDGIIAPGLVEKRVEKVIPTLKTLGKDKTIEFFTTHELFNLEAECIQLAEGMAQRETHPVRQSTLERVLTQNPYVNIGTTISKLAHWAGLKETPHHYARQDYSFFSEAQRDAVDYLTRGDSAIKVLSGRAGSGKTTVLSAARETWERSGYNVIGTALSGRAAQELSSGAGIRSETVRMTLMTLDPTFKQQASHGVRQLARAAQGKRTYTRANIKLNRKTVLVVDEATMIGTRDLARLEKLANDAGAKIVYAGDDRQLPSIEAGSPFKKLREQLDSYTLNENVRQKTKWLREAVDLYADERRRDALTKFMEADRLRFSQSKSEMIEGLVHDWKQHRTKDLSQSICLADTNQDVREINRKIQNYRLEHWELSKKSISWKETKYRIGDRIAFREIDRKLGVWNGDLGTITNVKPLSGRMTVELDKGRTIEFRPKDFGKEQKIELGYAITVHRAQGLSIDKSFVLLGDSALTSSESSYVALSRARHDTFVNASGLVGEYEHVSAAYDTQAIQQLSEQLNRSSSKQLAHELQQGLQL